MQKVIRWLRNKRIDILLVAAFVMVAFVVSNAGNLVLQIQEEIREKSVDSYKNRKEFWLDSNEEKNIPVKQIDELLDEYEKERREDILSGIRILSGEIIEEL